MKIKPITRNSFAVTMAVLSALVVIAAPVAALFAVWSEDIRWLYTGGVLIVLAAALYFVASKLFDPEPDVPAFAAGGPVK